MPLPAPAVALLWGSGWTVPGAVGRKKVGEQPVPLHHSTPLSDLALGLGLYPSGQARLSGPCPDKASAPGPLSSISHLPCSTSLCPASLCLLAPDVRAHWPLSAAGCCSWGALCLHSSSPPPPTASPFCPVPSIEICGALVAACSCAHLLLLLLL